MIYHCYPAFIDFVCLHVSAPSKKLFTPGPLGVSLETKSAMLKDLGSRDVEFIDTVKFIKRKLLELAHASPNVFTVIPLQGSGTYAVEAVLSSVVPRENGKVLILVNGAYGRRMIQISDYMQCDKVILRTFFVPFSILYVLQLFPYVFYILSNINGFVIRTYQI